MGGKRQWPLQKGEIADMGRRDKRDRPGLPEAIGEALQAFLARSEQGQVSPLDVLNDRAYDALRTQFGAAQAVLEVGAQIRALQAEIQEVGRKQEHYLALAKQAREVGATDIAGSCVLGHELGQSQMARLMSRYEQMQAFLQGLAEYAMVAADQADTVTGTTAQLAAQYKAGLLVTGGRLSLPAPREALARNQAMREIREVNAKAQMVMTGQTLAGQVLSTEDAERALTMRTQADTSLNDRIQQAEEATASNRRLLPSLLSPGQLLLGSGGDKGTKGTVDGVGE